MLRKYPDKVLERVSKRVPVLLIPIVNWLVIGTMREVKNNNNGCGLACIQIGIALQVFLLNDTVIYNPKITRYGKAIGMVSEGCLSVSGEYFVNRSLSVSVEYYSDKQKLIKKELHGVDAIIFQHEYDHLQGITIADKGRKK